MSDSGDGRPLDRHLVKGGATTLVLSILDERPMHGYELIRTIRERSDGIFELSEGTVYPLLYALRDRGLLESESETSPEGRRRKVYRLTTAGREHLEELLDEWRLFREGMRLALGDAGGAR
ncbi:MAG: PadR family transcriptional regulator [Acidobacteriota bacterium]